MAEKIITKMMVRDYTRRLLAANARNAQKGLLMIYKEQTPMERAFRGQMLEEKNGFGFTAFDSDILSSFAEQFLLRGSLSMRQNQILMSRMPRYANQIVKIVGEEKISEVIRRKQAAERPLEETP